MDFVRVDLDGIDHEFGVSETVVSEPNSHGSQGRSSMKQGRKPFEQLMQTNLSAQSSPFPENENLSRSSLTKPLALLTSSTQLSFQSSYPSDSSNVDLHAVRGPFTPSQWLELEHQALIFKYITARVPIPPNLLLAIRRLLNPSTLYALSDSSLRSNHLGWEPFHLGCSGNLDPERGRCRRTDGKKWRCSRDAVADQKYCERHLNRGRHRSRKPVEGQTSRAIAGTASPKSVPVIATSSAAPETVSGIVSGSPAYHTQRGIETAHQSAGHNFCSGGNLPTNESKDRPGNTQNNLLLSSVNFKEKNSSSWPLKPQIFSHEWPHATGLDSILSDSLLGTADQRNSHSGQSKNFTLWSEANARETQQESPLCPFTDQWLKLDETMLERSQFSITMPNQEHQGLFSLKSDRETDLFEMSVGMEASNHSSSDRQSIWAPQTWQTSLGGPLAEVLNSTRRTSSCKSSSALNLQMSQDWDSSLPVVSSPTAVLVKTEFCSHSNSSAGSSPRAETNKASDRRLPDDNALNHNPTNSVTIIKC